MSDLQAALGLPQLDKLDAMYARRQVLRAYYDAAFGQLEGVDVVQLNPRGRSALHLYQLLLDPERLKISRAAFLAEAHRLGIELSVNYTPIHLFTWYREHLGFRQGDFPVAEYCGANVISLPFYPSMSDADAAWVCEGLVGLIAAHLK
jgi:dTDP-4-amino-4,6-dideoxygalactose transaminase